MAYLMHLLFLALGLIFLVKGSDYLVNSASTIAKKLGVSDFFIGLTLVAIGTSFPELASAIISSLKGVPELIIGNLFGANIANTGLILGICALIGTIKANEDMLDRDGYIMMFVAVITFLFAMNGIVTAIEGLVLVLIYFAYIRFLIQNRTELEKKLHFKEFLNYFFKFQYLLTIKSRTIKAFEGEKVVPKTAKEKKETRMFKEGLTKDLIIAAAASVALIFGAKLLINEAIWLSDLMGVSKTFIGMTVLALGTTLPELTVSLNAIRKGYGSLVIGNVIGSTIANLALVLGIAAIINPVAVAATSITYLIPIMLLFAIALMVFLRYNWKITKIEGTLLLLAYIAFVVFMYYKG